MELKQLLEMQYNLDEFIIESKSLQTLDPKVRLTNTILALMVEMGEFANELKSFKFWSNKPPSPKEVHLEEFVDVLHFFLSIANQMGYSAEEIEMAYTNKACKNAERQKNNY